MATIKQIEELDQKLDAILTNQTYIIQLLETIVEAIPTASKKPDVLKIMAPILNNPAVKGNPVIAQMLDGFIAQVSEVNK